jgi:hypothetical protein
MNGLGGRVVSLELDIRDCWDETNRSSSCDHLNSMKSSMVEESVPQNECPLANTEQSGLIFI